MIRLRLKTAAALAGLGLFCGCASTNNNACGEPRQSLFSRWFNCGGQRQTPCECIETGRVSIGEGPVVPEPGCGSPGAEGFPQGLPQGYPVETPVIPTMPPPTAFPLPGSNPLAQPVEAKPSSSVKDAGK